MSLILGTNDGVYQASDLSFGDATKVLDSDRVMRVRTFGKLDGVFAASKTGLYHSTDAGRSWTNLDAPREEVYSVLVSPDGRRLYAGTHPAHLFANEDGGESWRELEGFQDLPSREKWFTPRHRNEAHIRSLGAHPDTPDRMVAGVEVGGVHVSDDRGETWSERRDGVHDDVHHVLVRGPAEYIASCGGGLYRTQDAGRSWTRLDEGLDRRYFRESFAHERRLFTAAARGPPPTWNGDSGADGALFVSDDDGGTFTSLEYPGKPQEVVLAWTALDESLLAGTNDGRVLIETDNGWSSIGQIQPGIRSLCTV